MANTFFKFKQFTIHQDRSAMKVTTDACLFGAWVAERLESYSRTTVPGQSSAYKKLLDVGTGTGLLALMLAQKLPSYKIDAIELDEAAYGQARDNIISSPWHQQVTILKGDIRTAELPSTYDVIVCNPPFYEKELKGSDEQKNLAHHDAGLLLPELTILLKKYLHPGGQFFLLLPFKRNNEIKELLFRQELVITEMVFVRQSVKHDYFRILLEGKLKEMDQPETQINEISIVDEKQVYTPAFTDLLKEYYLNL